MPSKIASRHIDMSDLADDLLNSEIEEDQPAHPVINRTVIKKTATKSRAATGKTTAKKTTTAATKAAPKITKATKAQTEALKDRTNTAEGDDMDDVEEFDNNEQDDSVPVKSKAKRKAKAKDDDTEDGAPVKKAARATKAKTAPVAVAVAAREEIPDSQAPRARKPKTVKRAPEPEPIPSIPETQPEAEDISQSIEEGNEDDMEVDHEPPAPPPPVLKVAHRARSSSQQRQSLPHAIPQRARSTSVQPRTFSTSRAGSVSDNERRIAESDAKKKLHEITRKYEDMRMKYDSLQELAQNAAETNFDKLKRATDEKTKGERRLMIHFHRSIS